MRIVATIFFFFIHISSLKSKDEFVFGFIKNDLGEDLSDVKIHIKGSDRISKSNCEGYFKLEASKGDTLILSKLYYISEEWIVKSESRISIELNFNYSEVRHRIEANPIFSNLCNGSSSEPLFIVDGTTKENPYYHSIMNNLSEENLYSVFIVKEQKALDRLGPCAARGVVLPIPWTKKGVS